MLTLICANVSSIASISCDPSLLHLNMLGLILIRRFNSIFSSFFYTLRHPRRLFPPSYRRRRWHQPSLLISSSRLVLLFLSFSIPVLCGSQLTLLLLFPFPYLLSRFLLLASLARWLHTVRVAFTPPPPLFDRS